MKTWHKKKAKMYVIYVRSTREDIETAMNWEETPLQLHGTLPIEGVYRLYGAASPSISPKYKDYKHVFSEEEARKLPPHGPHNHSIETEGREPPYGPLYNFSADELKVLREYIEEQLAKGFIQPSSSPAGALVLFVPKKDRGLQLYVDYRDLNNLTKMNRYPLPLISEALDRLVGAKVYIKLDIRDAYNMIRIRDGDE